MNGTDEEFERWIADHVAEPTQGELEREQWTEEQWIEAYVAGNGGSLAKSIGRFLCLRDEHNPTVDPTTYEACNAHMDTAEYIEKIVRAIEGKP